MFNVVTIARKHGSEGSDIDAEWPECWVGKRGQKMIEPASAMGRTDTSWAEKGDEHTSAW